MKKQSKNQILKKASIIIKTLNHRDIITSITVYSKGNHIFNYRCSNGIGKGNKEDSEVAVFINEAIDKKDRNFELSSTSSYGAGIKRMRFNYYKLKK